MATKTSSKTASKKSGGKTASKKGGRKTTPRKAKPQPAPTSQNGKGFQAFTRAPKGGTPAVVRAISEYTGYFGNDGKFYSNGNLIANVSEYRVVSAEELDQPQNQQLKTTIQNQETWNKVGIPHQHRGENIHEQNPFLSDSQRRERSAQAHRQDMKQDLESTLVGQSAEEKNREIESGITQEEAV